MAKFNAATGAKGNAAATIAPTLAAADQFLGSYNWRDENALPPFPPGSLCDILEWIRELKSFNIAASAAGQLSQQKLDEVEHRFKGAGKRLNRWQSSLGACGYTVPDSTCAAQAQQDLATLQCIPVVRVPPDSLSLVGKMKRLSVQRQLSLPSKMKPLSALQQQQLGRSHLMKAKSTDTSTMTPYTPYINIRNSPNLDWTIQGYTTRDWERWDTFDYRGQYIDTTGSWAPQLGNIPQVGDTNTEFNAFTSTGPSTAPLPLSLATSSTNFARDWMLELSGSALRKVFFPSAYLTFRQWYDPTSSYSIMDSLYLAGDSYYFDSRLVMHNMSFSINQVYNMWSENNAGIVSAAARRPENPTGSDLFSLGCVMCVCVFQESGEEDGDHAEVQGQSNTASSSGKKRAAMTAAACSGGDGCSCGCG